METLLELFDRETMRNVLSAINFRPRRVLFLGESDMERKKEDILAFFRRQDYHPQTEFIIQDPSDFRGVLAQLRALKQKYPDLVMDITGGRNLALLSAGIFTATEQVPLFYFDWKRERYFSVQGCPDLENTRFSAKLTVQDVLTLFGCTYLGSAHLSGGQDPMRYRELIHRVWKIYLKYQDRWFGITGYLQNMGKANRAEGDPLYYDVPSVISLGSSSVSAPRRLLRELQAAGVLTELTFTGKRVRFRFINEAFRGWMSIAGIWLELELYLLCRESGWFDDVQMSVRADWDKDPSNGTNNELDVVATRGVFPTFFSCKTGSPKTPAIEEIAVLSRRFGGRMARAVMVTATDLDRDYPAVYQRALDMGITVITREDLVSGRAVEALRKL